MSIKSRFVNWVLKGLEGDKVVFMDDQYYSSLFSNLSKGMQLDSDSNQSNYVKVGYGGNADVFGMTNKMASAASNIPLVPFKDDKVSDIDPLKELFQSDVTDKTLIEARHEFFVFGYITGNGINYIPRLEAGNNKGKLIEGISCGILPTQYTEIISEGKEHPVGWYVVTLDNEQRKYDPQHVFHTRLFPNLEYRGGANFFGASPVKVAVDVIQSMNEGRNITKQTYSKPGPDMIIEEEVGGMNQGNMTKGEQSGAEKTWRSKTQSNRFLGIPMFTKKKLHIHKLGHDSFKDLDIINNDENGVRILSRIYGVSSRLFNDPEGASYNNKKDDEKAYYTNRIVPDVNREAEMWTSVFNEYYGIEYRPDFSSIEALQQDKKQMADIYQIGMQNSAVTENEFRMDVLGKDELTPDEIEELRASRDNLNNLNLFNDNLENDK